MIRYSYPKLYKRPIADRIAQLSAGGIIDSDTAQRFLDGQNMLTGEQADKMIENVIGVFGLPVGLGLNFLVNQKDYVVPMVVEEPSVLAAVSSAAKTIRQAGGFQTESADLLMIGQIVVTGINDPAAAGQAVLDHRQEILNLANSLHPKMVARGGGAIDIEIHQRDSERLHRKFLVVHLLIDAQDAMGANLVNSMCEGVAVLVENITGGSVFLKILSNYTDRSIVRAKAVVPPSLLEGKGFNGEDVRDRIVLASEFASIDPYRAATHNKGIMNGVDAVAIATGNDWRAIEASAHAHAARDSRYKSLSTWNVDADQNLVGDLELPLKVGIVGGSLQSNPAVADMLELLKVGSARELADVMVSVGLAQNFAALRALVTEGIQKGHMALHARSVAMAAGASPDQIDAVAEKLVKSGEIKVWKAHEILPEMGSSDFGAASRTTEPEKWPFGNGKFILFGEHAVVYGRHALAFPIPQAIKARIIEDSPGVHLSVPAWGINTHWMPNEEHQLSIFRAIDRILLQLGLTQPAIRIELIPQVPRAVGLGSSAAAAVAIVRALGDHFQIDLDDHHVNQIAYESERIVHGKPSGIDNTVATFARPILYKRDNPPLIDPIEVSKTLPIIIAYGNRESLTSKMVARVRDARQKNRVKIDAHFDRIDRIARHAVEAIQTYNLERLGELMNANQAALNQLAVSSSEQDEMIRTALDNGALGAKITGGGGGGAVLALCPDSEDEVTAALQDAGYHVLKPFIEPGYAKKAPDRTNLPITADQKPEDRLIVVNKKDEVLNFLPRSECHAGDGVLHRAFSIHIFNSDNQILLQRRSIHKELWPLFWSNSCCSHPRAGETNYDAAHRRLKEELGITARLEYHYKFTYQARYKDIGSENELCSVFIGQSDDTLKVDESEIAEWRYMDLDRLEHELKRNPEMFTPWFKMQWEQLRKRL